MTLDDRLKDAFQAKATTATPSPEAWDRIRSRTLRNPRVRLLQAAIVALSVPAVAVGVVVGVSHQNRAGQSPGVTVPPTSPSTAVSTQTPSAVETRKGPPPVPTTPISTPAGTDAYANAIAVAHAGGLIQFLDSSGRLLGDVIVTRLQGHSVGRIAWTPDRTRLYVTVSVGEAGVPNTGGCPPDAVAVDVKTGGATELGHWTDIAVSRDGTKLAAVVGRSCGPTTSADDKVLVRDLATNVDTFFPATAKSEWDAIGSLTWSPAGDRLAFVEYGPGDGSSLRSLDLAHDKTINDATPMPVSLPNPGEMAARIAYAGDRLVLAVQCCLNTDKYVHVEIRNPSTGALTDVGGGTGMAVAGLEAGPDGTSVAYLTSAGAVYSTDLSGAFTVVTHSASVSAIAW